MLNLCCRSMQFICGKVPTRRRRQLRACAALIILIHEARLVNFGLLLLLSLFASLSLVAFSAAHPLQLELALSLVTVVDCDALPSLPLSLLFNLFCLCVSPLHIFLFWAYYDIRLIWVIYWGNFMLLCDKESCHLQCVTVISPGVNECKRASVRVWVEPL